MCGQELAADAEEGQCLLQPERLKLEVMQSKGILPKTASCIWGYISCVMHVSWLFKSLPSDSSWVCIGAIPLSSIMPYFFNPYFEQEFSSYAIRFPQSQLFWSMSSLHIGDYVTTWGCLGFWRPRSWGKGHRSHRALLLTAAPWVDCTNSSTRGPCREKEAPAKPWVRAEQISSLSREC